MKENKKIKFLKEITNTPREKVTKNEKEGKSIEPKEIDYEIEKCELVLDDEILDLNIIDEDHFFTEEDLLLMQSEEIFADLKLDENDMIFINK